MPTYVLTHPYRRTWNQESKPVSFNGGRRLPVDVHADDDQFVITAAVPGLRPEDLEIQILDDVITLKGEIQQPQNGDSQILLHELANLGSFERSLRLPAPLDPEGAEAEIENGLLLVRVPKAETARPKAIKVNAR